MKKFFLAVLLILMTFNVQQTKASDVEDKEENNPIRHLKDLEEERKRTAPLSQDSTESFRQESPFFLLPEEIQNEIIKLLSLKDQVTFGLTCQSLRPICHGFPGRKKLCLNQEIGEAQTLQNFLDLKVLIIDSRYQHLKKALGSLPPNLTYLDLWKTQVTDEDLKALPLNLTSLELGSTSITGDGLKHLPQSLQKLGLMETEMTDEDLKNLPRSLQELTLADTKITDDGLKNLPRSLTFLDLSFTTIKDKGLKFLPPQITKLNLMRTQVTDAGLPYLTQLFIGLNLRQTQVTQEGMNTFKETNLKTTGVKWLPKEEESPF